MNQPPVPIARSRPRRPGDLSGSIGDKLLPLTSFAVPCAPVGAQSPGRPGKRLSPIEHGHPALGSARDRAIWIGSSTYRGAPPRPRRVADVARRSATQVFCHV